MLINSEIKTIYIGDDYPDKLAKEMLTEAGVDLYLLNRKTGSFVKIL